MPTAGAGVVLSADFDTSDLSQWSYQGPAGGMIQWASIEGQPPGALELSLPDLVDTARAVSICLPFGGDQPWMARADTMPVGPVNCAIDLTNHGEPDCSDPGGVLDSGPGNGTQNKWVTLDRRRDLFAFSDSTRAIRLELQTGAASSPSTGPGSCFFDNVVITGSLAPPVPVADVAGLGALALILALAAVWLLARRT